MHVVSDLGYDERYKYTFDVIAEYKCGKVLPANSCLHLINKMEQLTPLLSNTIVLVAHPDDEVIAFGAILQKMRRAVVVFATDGAPQDEFFWKQYGSRQAYAEVRRREACTALELVSARPFFLADLMPGGIADQQLFLNLTPAAAALKKLILELAPDCLLTLAYEGGHPDHDAACFLASVLGRRMGIPVWEGPLYHRNADGSNALQTFPQCTGNEVELLVEEEPLRRKIAMFRSYQSQRLVLDGFAPDRETLRPLNDYDFTRPPLPWKLNYEHWQWPMTGAEVAAKFSDFVDTERPGQFSN